MNLEIESKLKVKTVLQYLPRGGKNKGLFISVTDFCSKINFVLCLSQLLQEFVILVAPRGILVHSERHVLACMTSDRKCRHLLWVEVIGKAIGGELKGFEN